MKNKIKKILSILMISVMTMTGFGVSAFATGGTGDASLSNLEVSPGTLSPEFSSDCYEYRVEVGEDCDKLLVNAQTTDGGAKAVIAGNSGLKAGVNSVIINVTAADGTTTARYTIQVTRGAARAGDGSAAQDGQAAASGSQLGGGIASSPLIMGNRPSSESAETEGADSDGETPETDGEDLEDGQVPGGGELPEEETQNQGNPETAGQTAGTIVTAGKTYTLVIPDEAMVPSGFEAATVSIGGQPVSVWQFPSNYEVTGLYLFYGTSPEGKTTFYIYDEGEGTVITAAEGLLSIGQEGKISQNQLRSAQESYQKSLKSRMIVIICLSVLCFTLLIVLTASLTRRKHQEEPHRTAHRIYDRKSESEDEEDDFYGEEDGGFYEEEDDFYPEDEEDYDEAYGDAEEDYDEAYGDAEEDYDEDNFDTWAREVDGEASYEEDGAAVEESFLEEEPPEEAPTEERLPEPDVDREAFTAAEEEQKKKRLTETESEEKEPEGDTAPLPNLEDTSRLEPITEATLEAAGEAEDFDLEDVDLEFYDLAEDGAAGPGEEMPKEPGNSYAEMSGAFPVEEPEDDGMEEPEDDFMEEWESEADDVEEEAPGADIVEEPETEADGFEEITLEDVGFGEVNPAGEAREGESIEEKDEYSGEGEEPLEEEAFSEEEECSSEKDAYSDEEEWFPLPEEEEEDVDAEFDLLDALLSDSLRGGKPVGRK